MPITFKLIHSTGEPNTFYSNDQPAKGQEVELQIKNTGRGDITLKKGLYLNQTILETCQFILSFPAGFLANPNLNFIAKIPLGDLGVWKFKKWKNPKDGSDCYCLRRDSVLKEKIIKPGEIIKFTISEIKINEAKTRNTRLKLNYQNITEASRPVTGIAETVISIYKTFSFDLSNLGELTEITDLNHGLEEIGGLITQIADIAISPLKAHIINGWNFHIPSQQKKIDIEISLNPDFFSAHKLTGHVVGIQNETKISISTANGTLEIESVPTNWSSSANGEIHSIHPTEGEVFIGADDSDNDKSLLVSVSYTPPADFFGISFLQLRCKGFKTRNTDNAHDSDVIDFDLQIPIYIGPLRVNKNSLTIGSADNAASLEVYSKKENSPTLIVKDGKVGIGTDTPLGNLSLVNKEDSSVSLLFRSRDGKNNTDYSAARIQAGWENTETDYNQGFLKFDNVTKENGYQNTMTLKGGMVGIGTEKPEVTLDVKGDLKITGSSTLGGKLTIISGGLTVIGDSKLNSKLTVVDGMEVSGSSNLKGKLTVNENTTLKGDLEVKNNLKVINGLVIGEQPDDKKLTLCSHKLYNSSFINLLELSFGKIPFIAGHLYSFRIGHYENDLNHNLKFKKWFNVNHLGIVTIPNTLETNIIKIGNSELNEGNVKALLTLLRNEI